MDSSFEENEKLPTIISIRSLNKTHIEDKYRLGSCKYDYIKRVEFFGGLK